MGIFPRTAAGLWQTALQDGAAAAFLLLEVLLLRTLLLTLLYIHLDLSNFESCILLLHLASPAFCLKISTTFLFTSPGGLCSVTWCLFWPQDLPIISEVASSRLETNKSWLHSRVSSSATLSQNHWPDHTYGRSIVNWWWLTAIRVWAQPWQQQGTDLEALLTADSANSVSLFDPKLWGNKEDGSVCNLVYEYYKWFVIEGFIS